MDLIRTIEESQKKEKEAIGNFKVGDTVKVHFKIVEGKTERIQIYEGLVICFKNSNQIHNDYSFPLNRGCLHL